MTDRQAMTQPPGFERAERPNGGATAASLFAGIDEKFFAPVADLRLMKGWTPPGGRDGGRYLNRHDGGSLEFKQHRSYGPGDDVRRVDWGVFGRTKKLFTRVVEAEHTPELIIAIDLSASMSAGSGDSKFSLALEYALLLAFVALSSDYRVQLVPFGPPSGTETMRHITLVHPRQILSFAREAMAAWATGGSTDFEGLGNQSMAWRARGASLVIVSDFLIDVPDTEVQAPQAAIKSTSWFQLEKASEKAKTFDAARGSAQARILASLSMLHQALEPLNTPNVRGVLLGVTGAGEKSLVAARSVFDLESGFLQRVLFTKASQRAYRAARHAHRLALGEMAKDLGMAFIPVEGDDGGEKLGKGFGEGLSEGFGDGFGEGLSDGGGKGLGEGFGEDSGDQARNKRLSVRRAAILAVIAGLGFGPLGGNSSLDSDGLDKRGLNKADLA